MLLEPSNSEHDDKDVDEAEICENRNQVDVDLLVGLQLFDIDTLPARAFDNQFHAPIHTLPHTGGEGHSLRVESGFGRGTGAKEIRIDRFQIPVWIDDHQAQQAHENNPGICR